MKWGLVAFWPEARSPWLTEENRGNAVAKVKVLVANQPRLMRELVLEMITDHDDIEVVGEVAQEASILEKVDEFRPEFLITTLRRSEAMPALCDLLWERFPRLKVIALQSESNDSVLYWVNLNVQATRIETSEKGILDVLQGRTGTQQEKESDSSSKVN